MSKIFKRLFNVREDEFLVFAAFFFFYFLIGLQFSIGLAVSEALFLSHPKVGPGFLPYMYIFNALIIIVVSSIYSSFTDKLSIPSMFKAVLGFFIGLILVIRFAISADFQAWGLPIALPFLHTLFVMFTNMVPNNFRAFYGLYLDVLQAKRLVPIILTGGRYGGIVGGFSIPLLVFVLGSVANMLYFWIATIGVSIFLIAGIQVRLYDQLIEKPSAPQKRSTAKGISKGRSGLSLLKANRYVAAFSIFSFLIILLRSFQDFQYSVIFREVFQDKAQLASFLGLFTGIGSAVALLVQTFITPRLIRRLGLGTANLLYPLTSLIGLGAMIISPAFYSSIFLRFNNKNLQESIRNPINALLYNALPPNLRSRVGAFVAGQVVAIASILSGIILLIIKPTGLALLPLSPRWVAGITFVIALSYLATGFFLRSEYTAALRKMLEERNLGLFQFAQEGFGEIDENNMAILLKNLQEGDDELCIYAAGMIAESGKADAVNMILEEIPRRSGNCLCSLIRLLGQTPDAIENAQVRIIWREMLNSEDDGCRQATMDAISEARVIDDYVEQIQESLKHESPEVRARAIQLLVHSDDLFWLASGLQTLHAMLEQGNREEKVCALRCIGELENSRFVRRVIPFLSEPDLAVRETAMESIERLLQGQFQQNERMDEIVKTTLEDYHPAIRRRGVRLLGKRGSHSDFERLVASLADPDLQVRLETVSSLKEMKRRGALSLEGGALFGFLSRWIIPAKNGSVQEVSNDELIERLTTFSSEQLIGIYETINHLHTIELRGDSESLAMLRRTLNDRVREDQAQILELLGVIGDEKTVNTVSQSLAQGERTSRAIAIEALSNVRAVGDIRQLILMLEPLLLGGTTAEKLAEGRKTWDLPPAEFGEVLQNYMNSANPWLRAVAVHAAGHMLAGKQDLLLGGPVSTPIDRENWNKRIQALANDEDVYAREAAVSALASIETVYEHPPDWLLTASRDPDERVKKQARRVTARQEAFHSVEEIPFRTDGGANILTTIEKALFLRGVTLFESMTTEQLKILSDISTEIHFSPGKVIFEGGDPCDYLFVIVEGEVEIGKDFGKPTEQILASLASPASFGEIALFGDEGRSAGARSGTDVTLLGIEKDPLLGLIHEHTAISIAIIYELSSIVRNQDQTRTVSSPKVEF